MIENVAINFSPSSVGNEGPVVNPGYKISPDESTLELFKKTQSIANSPDGKKVPAGANMPPAMIFGGISSTVLSVVKAAKDKARKETLPLCSHRISLGKYGPGYPLYFEYIIVCGIILALMFGIVSIHSMYQNHHGDNCLLHALDTEYPCNGGTAILYSIGNRGPTDSFRVTSVLNLSFTLVALVFAFFYRKVLDKTADEVDDSTVTAADYTVMVQNLPPNETADSIQEFFQENGRDGKPVQVVSVAMAYQIGNYVNLIRKKEFINKKAKTKPLSNKSQKKLERVEKEIQDIRNGTANPIGFTGIAFVTFNTQKETTDVINKFSMGAVQEMLFSLFSPLAGVCGKESGKLYKSRIIKVNRSFEPADIFWENLGLPWKLVMKRKIINLVASGFLIICCFGLILGTKYIQTYVADHTTNKGAVTFLSLVCSVFVVIINASLGTFVRRLAQYEKPETNTSYQVNVAEGLSMAQFINTAFVTLIVKLVQAHKLRLWTADGIVPDFFFVFLLNSFVPSVTKIIDVGYFIKSYRRKRALDGKASKLSQVKADKLFEDPAFDVAQRYAAIQKTMLFTGFFATMIPLGVLFSLIGLFLTYWADKYQFLRRTNMPPVMGKVLAEEMADYLELIIVSFCAGNLVFEKIAADNVSVLNIVALIVAGVILIVPNGTLADCIFPEKENNEDTENNYAAAAEKERFYGYDELNPAVYDITKDDAVVVNDADAAEKNHQKGAFSGGVDLNALETYARERHTFLEAQKTKQKGKPVVTQRPQSKQAAMSPSRNAMFHMATTTVYENNNEGKISRLFKNVFGKKKTATKEQAPKDNKINEVTPREEVELLDSKTTPKNFSSAVVLNVPQENVKPKVLDSQQMRIGKSPTKRGFQDHQTADIEADSLC